MKKTLATLFLTGVMLFGGGCAVTKIPTNPNDPNFPSFVQKAKDETRTSTTVATSGVLLAIDPKERVKVAMEANAVAKQVKEIVNTGDVTLEDLRDIAVELVTSAEGDDATAGLLVNTIVTVVETNMHVHFDKLVGDQRLQVAKELINAAADSVITVTDPFVK